MANQSSKNKNTKKVNNKGGQNKNTNKQMIVICELVSVE